MTATLYLADNGEIVCAAHGGAYLTAAVAAAPTSPMHRTPLGTWEAVPADLLADEGLGCEVCA